MRDGNESPGADPAVDATSSLEICRDLRDRLEKLEARYGLLREIHARSGDAVFAKDRDGRYVLINPKGAEWFGRPAEEILGQDDQALLGPERADRIRKIDRAVMGTGQPSTFEETIEVRGVPVTLLTTVTAWYEPDGTLGGLIGNARDVTEHRRLERGAELQQDRLRSLASDTLFAEECLRQLLAADLQNNLGQDIALTKMMLSALRSSSSRELQEPLTRIERLLEGADRSLRTITFRLSPPSLHDLGLVPALRWLAEDIGGRYDLDVQVEDGGTPAAIENRVRVILFRAVRELLMNTARHARAHDVHVRLGAEDGHLSIAVEDDGEGFDATRIAPQGSGLFGIREHLRHVGGSMRIDSMPERGTTVELTVPLETPHTTSAVPSSAGRHA